MNTTTASSFKNQPDNQAAFSSPMDSIKEARLEITNGISNFDLRGGSAESNLFQAHFTGLIPEVRTERGVVSVRYRLSMAEWVKHSLLWKRHAAELSLNTAISWEIDFHGGVSNMQADLKTLVLNSLAFEGGVSRVKIDLPRPSGTVSINVKGGSSRQSLVCPQGIAVRLRASGGVSQLKFGEQFYGSAGERLELETPVSCPELVEGSGTSSTFVISEIHRKHTFGIYFRNVNMGLIGYPSWIHKMMFFGNRGSYISKLIEKEVMLIDCSLHLPSHLTLRG